jgi:organic radical activating enzyme
MLSKFGLWKIGNIIRRSTFVDFFRHTWRNQQICVNRKGKIVFPHCDINITLNCNLKCEYCSNFIPFQGGDIAKEDIANWIEIWSKRIEPKIIYILGGEPLLHPNYEEIVLAAQQAWKNSKICIITNGILLPKVHDEFLKIMADYSMEFRISHHINSKGMNHIINEQLKRLQQFGIRHDVSHAYNSWVTTHTLDKDGVPRSFNGNATKAWNNCLTKHCITIMGNKLFRCSRTSSIYQAVLDKKLPPEFNKILIHKPATVNDTTQEIERYLRDGVMDECSLCPERFISIESRQIPAKQLTTIKQIITEENRNYEKHINVTSIDNNVLTRHAG